MVVCLGINPITWTNDDMPKLGGDTPLEACLSEAYQAGFAGIEMGGKFPRRASDLAPILARHRLVLVSGWYSAQLRKRSVEEEMAAVSDHLDLLAAMGCRVMVFAEGHGSIDCDPQAPVSARPRLEASEWHAFGRKLTELAERMQERGVRLAFHHHMGTVVQTEDEVDMLMASTGAAVGLLLDTGHMVFAGGDPAAMARRHARRIVHVHCKDVRLPVLKASLAADQSFLAAVLDGVFTVPGDGGIDFPSILGPLAHSGYSGWLVVEAEQDPAKANPLTHACLGYENLNQMARKAGFVVADA